MVKIGRIVKRFLKNSKNSVRNWTVLRLKIEVCRSLQAECGLAMQSFCAQGACPLVQEVGFYTTHRQAQSGAYGISL